MASAKTVAHHLTYGGKRDYPKIDIFHDGQYAGTTTWARTCKEARKQWLKAHPDAYASKTTARFQRR